MPTKRLSDEYTSTLGGNRQALGQGDSTAQPSFRRPTPTGITPITNNGVPKPRRRSGSLPEQTPSFADQYQQEMVKAAREGNTRLMYQSAIAAANRNANAQRYLANELAAQGLGTQGYGTSAHVGLTNQYMNELADVRSEYDQAERDLDLQEAEYQANKEETEKAEAEQDAIEQDNQLITFLQSAAGDEEKIKKYMEIYGYGQDEKGNWYKTNEDGSLDPSRPANSYIKAAIYGATADENSSGNPYQSGSNKEYVDTATYLLNAYTKNEKGGVTTYLGDKNTIEGGGYTREELGALKVNYHDGEYGPNKENKGKERDLNWLVGDELEQMYNMVANGSIPDGTLFKLTRKSDKKEAYLILWLGGKYYVVSDDDNEKEGGQVAYRYNSYQGPKYEF